MIIGLGNPGEKYKHTRHNLGSMAVDYLREKLDAPNFKFNPRCAAEISKIRKYILAKPHTFMNNSDEAVAKLLSFYKLSPADIIVIHDDLDLDFGKIKAGANRGSAGHNGVQSIIDTLGTKDFRRVRLGVGRPSQHIPPPLRPWSFPRRSASFAGQVAGRAEDYVLQNFSSEELKQLPDIFKKIPV